MNQSLLLWLIPGMALVAAETWSLRWMSREGPWQGSFRKVLLSHLPWALAWLYPLGKGLVLPDPHNFELRKVEILLGTCWMSHLFLFSGFLLAGSYGKGWKHSRIFGLVAAFLFTGATLWTAQVCEPSGDEPHYLLMAYSLVHDGDLDLSNNYAHGDYLGFYHRGVLEPQGLEHQVGGKRFSHHPLGPVLVILPGFLCLGRLGAALTMALLAALALYWTLRVMEGSGAKGWPLHATGVIGLFSSPFLLFAGVLYPEVPTACLVVMALFFFSGRRWGWFGFSLGLMLWMHNRNMLLVIPFFLCGLYSILFRKEGGGRGRDFLSLALGGALPVLALVGYFHGIYGVWTPLGAHHEPFVSLFRVSHFWTGFFGLILDQECGLWFHFPIFGLIVTGGALLYKSSSPMKLPVLGVFVFYYLFMAFYENLGLTPATRYMVGVTPLLLTLLYPAVEVLGRDPWARRLSGLSLGAGAAVNWLLAAVPWMRYNKMDGENWILKIAGKVLGLPLTSTAPAFNLPNPSLQSYGIGLFWTAVTVLMTLWFLRSRRQGAGGSGTRS